MSKIIVIQEDDFRGYLDEVKESIIEEVKNHKSTATRPKFYRNKDLKEIFGFSDGTIINYRKRNILPYTFIDSIPFYPVDEINRLLEDNSNRNLI